MLAYMRLEACMTTLTRVSSTVSTLPIVPNHPPMQEPLEPYKLGYLAGLEVSISGYSRQKSQLAQMIQAGGATYMAQMNKQSCRVLVAEQADSSKAL
jgi:hypothetical protein